MGKIKVGYNSKRKQRTTPTAKDSDALVAKVKGVAALGHLVGADNVCEAVGGEETVGADLVEEESGAAANVEDVAAGGGGVQAAVVADLIELLRVTGVRPEDLPGGGRIHLGVGQLLAEGVQGGDRGRRAGDPAVGAVDGVVDDRRDGQLVEDLIGGLPDLQPYLFAVLRGALPLVAVVGLQGAHLKAAIRNTVSEMQNSNSRAYLPHGCPAAG